MPRLGSTTRGRDSECDGRDLRPCAAALGRRPSSVPAKPRGRTSRVACLVCDNVKVGGHLVGDWLGRLRTRRVDSIVPGEGGVVRQNGMNIGASRGEAGAVFAVSLICTHVGCTVCWNAAETTWDCPCHGSRFNPDGTVLQGPAVRDLRRFDVSNEDR